MKTTSNKIGKMKKKKKSPTSVFWKPVIKRKEKKVQPPLQELFIIKPVSVPKQRKTLKNQNNLSFLYNAVPKKLVTRNEKGMRLYPTVKMKPNPLWIKESINQKRPLNEWGDVDLDGSPNKFDCNPRNPAQDGVFARALGMVTRGKYGQTKEQFREERERKKATKFTKQFVETVKEEKEARAARKKFANLAEKRVGELLKQEGIKLSKSKKKIIVDGKEVEEKSEEEKFREKLRDQAKALLTKEQTARVASPLRIETERKIERLAKTGKAGELALAKAEVRERIKKGKEPSLKQLKKVVTLKRELKEKKIAKGRRIVGGILAAVTPLGALPEIRKLQSTGRKVEEGRKGRGRPKGPAGTYRVDGVPVYEAQFQQVRSAENRKRKALGMETIPIGVRQVSTTKQAVPTVERRPTQPQQVLPQQERIADEVPQEYIMEEGEAIPAELDAEPQQPQQGRRVLTQREAQMQEQRDDNILKAPNFQKGELQQTAGVFSEDPRYNILNAPNFQRGGLRRVGETEETQIVTVGERPNPNPYGDEFTEIDPGSGRTIVKRRPKEKWVTGEAL